MRRNGSVLLLGVVFLFGCSGASADPAFESTELTVPVTGSSLSSSLPDPGQREPSFPTPVSEPSATRTLVALGDSYAAGVGSSGMTSSCGRSTSSWTGLLAGDLGMDFVNLACGGATLLDALEQVEELPAEVDVVALSIGGNSLEFGRVLTLCMTGQCELARDISLSNMPKIRPGTVELLTRIHRARPGVSTILITLYPFTTQPGLACDRVSEEMSEFFHEGIVLINNELRDAATDAAAAGVPVRVVDAATFADHTLCTEEQWVHDFSMGMLAMHPNDAGYVAMASAALEVAISAPE